MPSDYGDLSRIALEAELDPDELRARLARMERPFIVSGTATPPSTRVIVIRLALAETLVARRNRSNQNASFPAPGGRER